MIGLHLLVAIATQVRKHVGHLGLPCCSILRCVLLSLIIIRRLERYDIKSVLAVGSVEATTMHLRSIKAAQ